MLLVAQWCSCKQEASQLESPRGLFCEFPCCGPSPGTWASPSSQGSPCRAHVLLQSFWNTCETHPVSPPVSEPCINREALDSDRCRFYASNHAFSASAATAYWATHSKCPDGAFYLPLWSSPPQNVADLMLTSSYLSCPFTVCIHAYR